MTRKATHRRGVGGPVLLALAVVIAGCGGTLVERSAEPATIPDGALEPHGYRHGNTTEVPITYPVGMAGISRNVTARTWVSGYTKPTAENGTAALVLYSSPNVEVAGTSVNPLSQLSNRELVRFVLERTSDRRGFAGVDETGDLRVVGTRNVTVLGSSTRMTSYAGSAGVDDRRAEIVVNVAVVEHADDVVVAIGFHDPGVDERATQAALFERVEHDG